MADHLDGDIQLTPRHVPFLCGHLSRFAFKWRDIGTALEFQSQDLRNIEASPSLIATAPSSYMQRLVEEWLEGNYPHTAPPTLANLLKALNSHTVGLGTLATQLRNLLPQHGQSVDAKVFEIASVSDLGDILFNRSEDIRVNEDTRVLLRVNVTQKCKWDNTGLVPMYYKKDEWSDELICNELYSDSDKPTLCITKADIDMDGGQYFCRVKTSTASVTFRVNCPQLDQFKQSLASIYMAQPEVPQDSWPPVSNKTYINLALIKQQAINYGGGYTRLTIRGDMDDILHDKEKIEYKNMFDGLKSGSLLIIEGRPGSGKTTFVHKITRDWAASEVQGPVRLILLVSLRVLNNWKKPVTLNDILQLLKIRVSPIVLEERNGKGVCFIFDGLDEFSPLEGENSVVYEIINKTYLPQSIVIVASRPAALVNLRQKADREIEVIGFLKDQIFEYIKNYHFSNTSKSEELKLYLLSHPNVLHMCYLPIHAAMVAFLFEVMGEVPRTETEIYKHFTRFTLMRCLSKHKGQDELEDMDTNKLDGKEKELFDTICEFALEKTIQKKQVLDQSEMKLRLQGKGCKDISLGLVTVDRTAGLYGFKNIYTFLHLTYQEYLAAHHISTLSDEDQHKLIKQYGDTDHMQVVWKFYCGLVKFKQHKYKIKALVSGRNKMGEIDLFDIQCAYESQQEIACNILIKEMDAKIKLYERKFLTTTDFTALGYLLANSSMPVSLSLIKCNLHTESANTLLAEIGGKPLSLQTLYCESNKTDLAALILLLRNNSMPVSLSLIKCDLHTESANTLLAEIGGKPLSLQTLYCESNKTDLDTLILFLRNSSELVSLSLINCKLNKTLLKETEGKLLCLRDLCYKSHDIDFESLTNLLLQLHSLECLKISYTSSRTSLDYHKFSNIVSTSLANLKELFLTNVRVTLSSVLQLCQMKLKIMSCSYTQGNDVWSICITRTGIDFDEVPLPTSQASMLYVQGDRENYLQTIKLEVASISTSNLESSKDYWPTTPKVLVLQQQVSWSHCKVMFKVVEFGSDFSALEKLIFRSVAIDTTILADGILRHCVMLQELELSRGQTVMGEFKSIIFGLKNCSKLQKLILNNNNYIKTDDACVLASCLQHWPKLQELHLRRCGIKEEGAKAIADNIKYCKLNEVDLKENKISKKTLQVIESNLQLHNEVTKSSSPPHNEVTKSSSPSHNEVTKSSSPSHNEVTESSSPLHNEVTKSSLLLSFELTDPESNSPSHNTCCCTLF